MNKCEFCGKFMKEEEYNFCDICPDCRDKYQYFLYEGNNLLFSGAVSKQDDSFVVNNIFEI